MNAHEGPIAAREFATEWDAEAERLLAEYERAPLPQLLASAQALGREGHGNHHVQVSFESSQVFS